MAKAKEEKEGSSGRVSLAEFSKSVNKQKGINTMILSRNIPDFRVIPSGIFILDFAVYGGIPQYINTYKGGESGGKSTQVFRSIHEAQKKYPNSKAVLVDVEGTFSPLWAEQNGVDLDRLQVTKPATGEDALDIARDTICKTNDTCLLAIDCMASLCPSAESEGSTSDSQMAALPRMVNKFLRPLFADLAEANREGLFPLVILVNQYRSKVGLVFGNPESETGGKLLKHAPALSIDFRSKEIIPPKSDFITHNECAFTITKSKLGTTIKSGEFKVNRDPSSMYAIGEIMDIKTVLAYAARLNIITGSAAGMAWGDRKLGSSNVAIDMLHKHKDLLQLLKITTIIEHRTKMGMKPLPPDGYLLEDVKTFVPKVADKYKIAGTYDGSTAGIKKSKKVQSTNEITDSGEGDSEED